jgi:hypothetical protein
MIGQDRDRAVLGRTDVAMRRYLPPQILSLTVSPARFARMVDYPESWFLHKEWWNDLMEARTKGVS